MSFYLDIMPKNGKLFPEDIYKRIPKLYNVFDKSDYFDYDYTKLMLVYERESWDLGLEVAEAKKNNHINKDVMYLYNWAKKDNIIVKASFDNARGYKLCYDTTEDFFNIIEDNRLTYKDIDDYIALLCMLKEYDHDNFDWRYIRIRDKRYMVLVDNYNPLEDLVFKWVIQIDEKDSLSKELKIPNISEVIDDNITLVRDNFVIESELYNYGHEVFDLNLDAIL